ncbi:hypothetical protein F5883DRAFT_362826, partial [Diaporthe sp. PMI_573]
NIDVTLKRTERIANELFGVCLEHDAGIWYVCIGHTRLLPEPRSKLECCRTDIIPLFFGSTLTEAVLSGPVYQEE